MNARRRNGIALGGVASVIVVLVVLGALAGVAHRGASGVTTSTLQPKVTTTTNPYAAIEASSTAAAEKAVDVTLPTARGAPAPVLGARPFVKPLGSHVVVGFVPYYELGTVANESLAGYTDVVYSAIDVAEGGALVESGSSQNGWPDLSQDEVGGLIASAHDEKDRVLLSVFTESAGVLSSLCSDPTKTGDRLAHAVGPLLGQYGFDGVDLDIEGTDTSERSGFVSFVKAFATTLRGVDRSWTIMLNTYPGSAESTVGFFDVSALAPLVDDLFVMAYDMDDAEIPSPNAPLTGSSLSVASALATYSAAGLAGKTILGCPFYGYDFPAQGSAVPSEAAGQPYAVTFDQIVSSVADDGHKVVWDPSSETPYTVFRHSRQWHQTWFDNGVSIALKVALAAQFHTAGVGAWEIGMVSSDPAMVSVLAGGSTVVKVPLATEP